MEISLSDKITQLRRTIADIDSLSEEKRAQLLQSIDELDVAAPAGDESHQPFLGHLEDSLIEVEARHPDAAQLLRSFGDALGRMGL